MRLLLNVAIRTRDEVIVDHLISQVPRLSLWVEEDLKSSNAPIHQAINIGWVQMIDRIILLHVPGEQRSQVIRDGVILACKIGRVEILYRMLSLVPEVEKARVIHNGLRSAITAGQVETVYQMLLLLPEDERSPFIHEGLRSAITAGHVELAKWFHRRHQASMDLDHLSLATAEGKVEIIEWLLTFPHIVDELASCEPTKSPLAIAYSHSFIPIMQMLLDKGASPNIHFYGMPIIQHLVRSMNKETTKGSSKYEVLELLLRPHYGADASSAFLMAAVKGLHSIVKLLCVSGANQLQLDEDGFTAIALAAKNSDPDMVQLLVEQGSNGHPEEFKASLIQAWQVLPSTRLSRILSIAKILVQAGVDVNTTVGDHLGEHLLQVLVKDGYLWYEPKIQALKKFLLSKGLKE